MQLFLLVIANLHIQLIHIQLINCDLWGSYMATFVSSSHQFFAIVDNQICVVWIFDSDKVEVQIE